MHPDRPHAQLLGLATAEAPFAEPQDRIEEAALAIFRTPSFDPASLRSVFDHAGIRRRTLAQPLAHYLEPAGPAVRAEVFASAAHDMLARAARGVLTPERAAAVTHVLTVCSTGVATPSLECRLIEELGLPQDVQRLPLFGLGCAGGVAGLQIARDLCASSPDALVLCLCVELTSLTLFHQDQTPRNFVACALFGDGAAAALVGAPRQGERAPMTLGAGTSQTFPDTLGLMGWDVRDEGWQVVFSQRIPAFLRQEIRPLVERLGAPEAFRHLALHPGGARVLDAYRSALDVHDGRLEPSSAVLARHGNMSAATVFFVLDALLRSGDPGPGLTAAVGPGFSANLLCFELLEEAAR